MMERTREAAVWERVRAAAASAPAPAVPSAPIHNRIQKKTPTQRVGVTVSGPLPLAILLVILLRR